VKYRPHLESGVLRQMHGLPEHGFDMLVTLLARICDDPYDPVFSGPTGVPQRRVADVGDFVAVSTPFGPTYYFDSAPSGLSLLWRGVIVLL